MQSSNFSNILRHLLDTLGCRAVIFDLDGTLIDNNAYHLKAWLSYLERAGIHVTEEEYRKNFNGRTNKDVIEHIFQRTMPDEEAMKFALEKEALYREIYAPYIKPVDGLPDFLESLHQLSIPMAIATSGIQVNIDFMFDHLPIKHYFKAVLNSSHIQKGKPDPEIYLKTAAALNIAPGECLVFEDATVGIISAKRAGMKTIAITTTQTKEELSAADFIIANYLPNSFTSLDLA